MALDKDFNEAKKAASGVSEEIDNLYNQLRGVTSEIKGQATSLSKSRAAFKAFEKGAQDLKLQFEQVNNLSDDQVKKLNEQLIKQKSIASQEAQRLLGEKNIANQMKEIEQLLAQENYSLEEQNDLRLSMIQDMQHLSDEEKAILSTQYDSRDVLQEIVDESSLELEHREKINKALGVSGAILEGLNELGGSFAKAFKLDKVASDMRTFADETVRAEGGVSRLRVLGVGLKSAFKNAFATLTDPSVIIGGALKGFSQVDKANVDFQRQTGQSLNTIGTGLDSSNAGFITLSDYIKTASELTKELGQNATAIFTPDDLVEASEMVNAMGMASKEAAKLAQFSKINGGNIEAQNEAIVAGVNASNRQNKTAVAAGDVLKDVANVSEGIAVSYAGYPEKLGAAASAAKALGMDLGKVDSIANSLLDFEQSISNELEAELLTGRDINLEKARELALNNDLEGVAKEIAQQGITASEFSKMNRIEQEAQAKALGMNRDELGKMLLTQKATMDISEEALSDAQKQTLEQLKQQEASEKFQKSVEKIQQALAPIVGFFADILSSVTGFLTQTYLIYPILGIMATVYVAKMVKGFKGMRDDLKDMMKSAKELGKSLFDKITGKGKGGPTDKLKETLSGAGDKTKGLQDKTKGAKGEGPGGFLKSLGDGLASIGKKFGDVVKGALALGIAGIALGGSFALALMMVKDVDPVQMIAFAGSLTMLGLTMALLGKIGSQVIQGALAMAVLGVALIPAAFAFSLLEGLDVDALIAFSIALPLLSLAAAGLGFIAPFIIAGSAALAILGLSLIPLAIGFEKMAGANVEGLVQHLSGLAGVAPQLLGVAVGLGAISAGLASMAITGILALPIIGALTALGSVSGALGSIFGEEKETTENPEMAKINANLERLIALVEKEGSVYLDGQKVGTALSMGTYRTQ